MINEINVFHNVFVFVFKANLYIFIVWACEWWQTKLQVEPFYSTLSYHNHLTPVSGSVSRSFELVTVYIALMLASLFFYWHVDDSIPNFRWRLFIWLMAILIMKIVLYVWYWLLEIEVMVIYILRRQKVINQFQGKKDLQLLDGSHWG